MHNLNIFLSKHFILRFLKHKAVLAFTLIALLTLINCGKRKPPLPPIERVQQRAELTGFQRGDKIILNWKMPARNADASDLLNINRADIYRLVEPASAPYSLSEDEFASKSVVISSIEIVNSDFFNTKSVIDKLEFIGQNVRLRYAVRFSNKNGQNAAFSNFLLIEPTSTIPNAPSKLETTVDQNFISLNWQVPKGNIDNSSASGILGYNVYRSESENESAKLITKTPVSGNTFDDAFFEFGKTYYYFVRAVSLDINGEPLESNESNIVKVAPTDSFVPSSPNSVTIAASPGMISIFFAVNPENDVIGYKVFRTTDPNSPMADWIQIHDDLLKINSIQDTKVESGIKYYYYLVAIDKAGNVSKPSEVISETAP